MPSCVAKKLSAVVLVRAVASYTRRSRVRFFLTPAAVLPDAVYPRCCIMSPFRVAVEARGEGERRIWTSVRYSR